jgi:hypothetical protein
LKGDEEHEYVGGLSVTWSLLGTAKFVFKMFGYNGIGICVGNTGSRLRFEVFWNTRLECNECYKYIDVIYSLVRNRKFKKLVARLSRDENP